MFPSKQTVGCPFHSIRKQTVNYSIIKPRYFYEARKRNLKLKYNFLYEANKLSWRELKSLYF